jgi:hypothetical protein
MVDVPLVLLAVHALADFRVQTNWQALNKSKDNWALTSHVMTYSLCFFPWGLKFMLITFVLHWITDYFTSRQTAANWYIQMTPLQGTDPKEGYRVATHFAYFDEEKRPKFWGWIGLDQLIHAACLGVTYQWLN